VTLVSSDESASVEEAPAKNSRKCIGAADISIWKGDGVQIFVSTRHRQFKDEKLTKLGRFGQVVGSHAAGRKNNCAQA
jgi:hypothetical protein